MFGSIRHKHRGSLRKRYSRRLPPSSPARRSPSTPSAAKPSIASTSRTTRFTCAALQRRSICKASCAMARRLRSAPIRSLARRASWRPHPRPTGLPRSEENAVDASPAQLRPWQHARLPRGEAARRSFVARAPDGVRSTTPEMQIYCSGAVQHELLHTHR